MKIGETLGAYQVLDKLGEGGMGEVYRARDLRLDRIVAIKVLRPDSSAAGDPSSGLASSRAQARDDRQERFSREVQAVAALSHPNIVAIHDVGTEQGVTFAVMELLEGATLRQVLAEGRVPVRTALDYALQIAQGLAAAHARGFVHRDIKPENLFITSDGQAKILDFGLAKALGPQESPVPPDGATTISSPTPTAPGLILGTAGYLSPEQATGRQVDHRSDIFSFGCVLHEMVTGRRCFAGRSAIEAVHAALHAAPPPLTADAPDAPLDLQRIVAKCLAKDANDRYQSTRDLVVDLRNLARQVDSSSLPFGAHAAPAGPRRRLRRLGIVASFGLVLLVLLAGAAALWTRGPAAEPDGAGRAVAPRIERLTTIGKVIDAVISPDGKYLAYTIADQAQQSLWVRQLDTASALELVPPASVGYWGIEFQPDSAAILYALRSDEHPTGALFRIPVLGGTPRRLVTGVGSAVTFSPDGRRVAYLRGDYPEPGSSAVMVAGADGTGARALATRQPPEYFAPIFFATPSWSPDGRTIAVPIETRGDRPAARVVLLDAANGQEQQVPNGQWPALGQVEWLPDGNGLAVIAGPPTQVWLLDSASGARRAVTNDLFQYRRLSLTADSKTLVSVASEVMASIWVAPANGHGAAVRAAAGRTDGLAGLAWASDDRLLFRSLESGRPDIWTMRTDGGERRQITTDGGSSGVRLLPGGRSIVFLSERGQPLAAWKSDLEGQEAVRLDGTELAEDLVPSPDGTWMAFVSSRGGVRSVWSIGLDGGAAKALIPAFSIRPAISPDGKQIACYYRARPDARLVLAVIPVGAAEPTATFPVLPSNFYATVRWTPDGRGLLHNSAMNDRANVWLQPLDGGPARRVTDFPDLDILTFDLSPDGTRLAIARGILSRDAVRIRDFR